MFNAQAKVRVQHLASLYRSLYKINVTWYLPCTCTINGIYSVHVEIAYYLVVYYYMSMITKHPYQRCMTGKALESEHTIMQAKVMIRVQHVAFFCIDHHTKLMFTRYLSCMCSIPRPCIQCTQQLWFRYTMIMNLNQL